MIQQIDVFNVFASSSIENLILTTKLEKSKINGLIYNQLNTCF
jgi:hypothetical protein